MKRYSDGEEVALFTPTSMDSGEIPDELALREIPKLDEHDPQALADFMNRYGALAPFSGNSVRLLPPSSGAWSIGGEMEPDSLHTLGAGWVAYCVQAVRAVVAHWLAFQHGDDEGILAAWGSWAGDPPADIEDAWDRWTDHLNYALAPLAVQVGVVGPNRQHGRVPPTAGTSYTAMMVQIYNDIVTDTAWKVCENEPCRGLFARQQGRAEAGQYRTSGVIYCSKSCARAQTQRNHRRRAAAKKGASQ